MNRFVRVTDAANNKIFYINVDHVRSVTEIPRGSQITFADGGATLAVSEGLEAVMKAIELGDNA